jgi:PERQ amino acid-rich with GYF domain-containing protein
VPPHLSSNYSSNSLRNGTVSEGRYSKDQMLGLYKEQRDGGNWGQNISEAFMGTWDPHNPSAGSNGTWGKKDEKEGASGPEICWIHGGNIDPLGLIDMDDEERDVRCCDSGRACEL